MISDIDFTPELSFKTSRSGGSGGQHVNKTSTKVELNFDVDQSALLSDKQKRRIHKKLANRINNEGILRVVVEEERSQRKNKKIAVERFYELITNALKKKKKRIPTKVPDAVKEKRLEEKKKQSGKKQMRKKDIL